MSFQAADDRSKRPTVLLALEEYGSGSEDEEDPGPIAPPVSSSPAKEAEKSPSPVAPQPNVGQISNADRNEDNQQANQPMKREQTPSLPLEPEREQSLPHPNDVGMPINPDLQDKPMFNYVTPVPRAGSVDYPMADSTSRDSPLTSGSRQSSIVPVSRSMPPTSYPHDGVIHDIEAASKEMPCKWYGCGMPIYDTHTSIHQHLSNHHGIKGNVTKVPCLWINDNSKMEVCGGAYDGHSLARHLESQCHITGTDRHTGEFICAACGTRYRRRTSCTRHYATAHLVCPYRNCRTRFKTIQEVEACAATHGSPNDWEKPPANKPRYYRTLEEANAAIAAANASPSTQTQPQRHVWDNYDEEPDVQK
ncbi:uncharacterized protein STEHIDRAFT_163499 [Stereum hirsutum FP-91666 SS1]|uniref:C2H2-type domain-containing protein n=1 Tax=Stereum hirsutum (strain FP-91666) TaxID=721885 RepID=R7RXQ8_STEHR|nr:uncharacterized protein STEHIDRAFT_163499 [Stereum hirsutum FP-91666 SS1]EIM79675.1 hypothetical protein STEHIDRAFT_163499 [Stereum hirsutum FP-91666 SS1]